MDKPSLDIIEAYQAVCATANGFVRLDPDYDPKKEVRDTISMLIASAHALAVATGSTAVGACKELRQALDQIERTVAKADWRLK